MHLACCASVKKNIKNVSNGNRKTCWPRTHSTHLIRMSIVSHSHKFDSVLIIYTNLEKEQRTIKSIKYKF